MNLWRLSSHPTLSGEGGLHFSGRWHHAGHRVVYASEHPALAILEVLAHLHGPIDHAPRGLSLMQIDVPDAASMSGTFALPAGWQHNEPVTQEFGSRWLDAGDALLVPVPSVLVPHATNYVINPSHPQARDCLTVTAPPSRSGSMHGWLPPAELRHRRHPCSRIIRA